MFYVFREKEKRFFPSKSLEETKMRLMRVANSIPQSLITIFLGGFQLGNSTSLAYVVLKNVYTSYKIVFLCST